MPIRAKQPRTAPIMRPRVTIGLFFDGEGGGGAVVVVDVEEVVEVVEEVLVEVLVSEVVIEVLVGMKTVGRDAGEVTTTMVVVVIVVPESVVVDAGVDDVVGFGSMLTSLVR